MTLDPEHAEWLSKLKTFVETRRNAPPVDDSTELAPVVDEQRRITGGALMQFLEFVQSESSFETFPILEDRPISDRAFLFATDRAGVAAAGDILDRDSDRVIVLLKNEWKAWLEAPTTDSDDQFEHHYQFWSVWHRNVDPSWEIPDEPSGQLWVHEEGFALADRAGSGSRHLWSWDDGEMDLIEQEIETWDSARGAP
jgi:hypothetical protein